MEFNALKLKIASPEEILSWSRGEVVKPETINYRTQRPEKDGLFSERIFGPTKDYECYCGKYRRIRYRGVICDKCGVEVTRSAVRRERMGHITLASPCAHIWFLRAIPSKIGLFLDAPPQKLEKVIYYAAYIVVAVDEKALQEALNNLAKNPAAESLEKIKLDLSSLRVGSVMAEGEYLELSKRFSHIFKAGRGAEAVRQILEKIDFKKEIQKIEKELEKSKDVSRERRLLLRLKLNKSFLQNKMRPEWMVLTALPILPPDLRPMVALEGGRYASSDLNDLYRRVINRNNRLKKLIELKAPEIIVANEKRMLQEAVDALIDNSTRISATPQMSSRRRPLRSLADMLRGKQGRFRQNLLGKRVDYSGRSVIVVGPELKLNECGLPKKMAMELFKPFVIGRLITQGLAHNIRSANRLIEQAPPEIWAVLEEVIAEKKVLLNRAPTLHRLGIQAFRPLLTEDLSIRIPPMVCAAFNADFDGDQMAVHLPLSEEAQKEAEGVMLSTKNLLKPATGEPITTPSQDIVLGCYYLTKIIPKDGPLKVFASIKEAILSYELDSVTVNEPIKIKGSAVKVNEKIVETSTGRLIFNSLLPEDFGFINQNLKRRDLQKVTAELIEKYGAEKTWPILDAIKTLGFELATKSGISWGMNDLTSPQKKTELIKTAEKKSEFIRKQYEDGLLTDSERLSRTVEIWEAVKNEITKETPSLLDPYGSVFAIIDSGSRGSWSTVVQMMGMKGLVQGPTGETIELPIKSSYKEGLTASEYFINTHSARKGLIDTALKTASAGYLTRRLVDVSQDVVVREKDCHTTEGIEIFRKDGNEFNYAFEQRLFGRTSTEDIRVDRKIVISASQIIDKKTALIIEKSKVESVSVRSPITCKTVYGICSKCYGLDLTKNDQVKLGETVGIIAAQSIGEPGTQLTLRTFHLGGVAGVDITHGLPRVQELFEVRPPRGGAILTSFDGVIKEIENKDQFRVIKIKTRSGDKKKNTEYQVPNSMMLIVNIGDKVEAGDRLSEGNIDLRDLFELKGRREVERYIINEVQKIYVSEGTMISDKHIEVIVRQMFSRVAIKDVGNSDFVVGEVIEKSTLLEVNQRLRAQNKKPAKAEQLLLGITKVSLSAESFLSAASFQETARVLVKAASEGRVDNLRGLKENVIIGRLIPTTSTPKF